MAAIRKHGSKYQVQIRKQGHKPISKSFIRKSDANKWATKIESELDRGVYLDLHVAQTTTLTGLLNRYETDILPCKRSIRPVKVSLGIIRRAIGHHTLSTLTPSIIAAYRDTRLETVSNETVRKELSYLRTAINTGIQEWAIHLPHGNPVINVKKPSVPRGRSRRLETGEEQRLLKALSDTPTVLSIVMLALETAMRRSEIVNTMWGDINLNTKVLHIPNTKTIPRDIPLSPRAIDVIKNTVRNLNGRLFDIKPDSVTQAFTRACIRANITGLRFHDLRHEATSRLFEQYGFNSMEVASITGHQDLRMLRRYTHLRATDLAQRL